MFGIEKNKKKSKQSAGRAKQSASRAKHAGRSVGKDTSRHINGMVGSSLNFAAREAYKQLRTNMNFALTDSEGSRAIGITSSMRGDGKSLTAINLSYSLAEDGYRTILIEGDLRIPPLRKKLGLSK